jgi:hypothetical protein
LKQGTKVCAKCRITVYKTSQTSDLYDNPGADVNELQKVEQEKQVSSHIAKYVSSSNAATEILTQQSTGYKGITN